MDTRGTKRFDTSEREPVDKELWITPTQGALSVGGTRFLIPKDKENKWRFEQ